MSYSALVSRRNSGLNRMRSVPFRAFSWAVYPTGMVDFITTVARSLAFRAASTTPSTADVSK